MNLLAFSRLSTWVRVDSIRSTRRSSALALRARFSVLARMESASVDEPLDLALLELGGALALGLVRLVLRLELRVVALPLGQALVRDVQHLGDGVVEQLQVVAHDEEGAGEARQLVEQPALGRAVEVVGRLVEDHQLGLLEQDPHQVDPAALATRQLVDVLEEQLLAQAEPVGQARHDRLGLVAAVGLELAPAGR